MTNEERQKLCATLRWYGDRLERELSGPMRDAADEIERLAKMMPEEMVPHKCFIPGCPVCDPPIAQGGTMTNEERQKLCESLRLAFSPWPCRIAADEIERLAREREETIKSSDAVCDSYAEENQRLSDKIERLTKKIAEAEAALRNTLLNYEISDVHSLTKST